MPINRKLPYNHSKVFWFFDGAWNLFAVYQSSPPNAVFPAASPRGGGTVVTLFPSPQPNDGGQYWSDVLPFNGAGDVFDAASTYHLESAWIDHSGELYIMTNRADRGWPILWRTAEFVDFPNLRALKFHIARRNPDLGPKDKDQQGD